MDSIETIPEEGLLSNRFMPCTSRKPAAGALEARSSIFRFFIGYVFRGLNSTGGEARD